MIRENEKRAVARFFPAMPALPHFFYQWLSPVARARADLGEARRAADMCKREADVLMPPRLREDDVGWCALDAIAAASAPLCNNKKAGRGPLFVGAVTGCLLAFALRRTGLHFLGMLVVGGRVDHIGWDFNASDA